MVAHLVNSRIYVVPLIIVVKGSVSEWLMEADCKSAGYAYASSNLARPTILGYND
jgi:hypothetical protein